MAIEWTENVPTGVRLWVGTSTRVVVREACVDDLVQACKRAGLRIMTTKQKELDDAEKQNRSFDDQLAARHKDIRAALGAQPGARTDHEAQRVVRERDEAKQSLMSTVADLAEVRAQLAHEATEKSALECANISLRADLEKFKSKLGELDCLSANTGPAIVADLRKVLGATEAEFVWEAARRVVQDNDAMSKWLSTLRATLDKEPTDEDLYNISEGCVGTLLEPPRALYNMGRRVAEGVATRLHDEVQTLRARVAELEALPRIASSEPHAVQKLPMDIFRRAAELKCSMEVNAQSDGRWELVVSGGVGGAVREYGVGYSVTATDVTKTLSRYLDQIESDRKAVAAQ